MLLEASTSEPGRQVDPSRWADGTDLPTDDIQITIR